MLHLTKVQQIAVKSWPRRLRKQAKIDTTSYHKFDRKLNRFLDDVCKLLGVMLGGFRKMLGFKSSPKLGLFFCCVF